MRNIPPKPATRLLRSFLRSDLVEEVEGDLEEKFYTTLKNKSHFSARLNYWSQVIHYIRPFAIRKARPYYLNNYAMFRNYFKIGWRNIIKYKAFSFINVFGLALAMAVCMLVLLMLADQKQYDQFNEKKDRTFRILSKIKHSTKPNASSPFPLGSALVSDYPIIEASTHLVPGVGGDITYQQQSVEIRGFFADTSFFNVFSFDLMDGDRNRALKSPRSIVLSREAANLLFGTEDPTGKVVEFSNRGLSTIKFEFGSDKDSAPISWGSYKVTGIIDAKKYKSHLKFDALISAASMPSLVGEKKIPDRTNDWENYSMCYTYVVLRPGNLEAELTRSLSDLVKRKYAAFENLQGFQLISQPLNKITPGIFVGNPASLQLPIEVYYFLGFLAIIIMLSACLNYTNLSVARALTRAKEIGVRKVTGARKRNLIVQFLSESVISALLALMVAGLLLVLLKAGFTQLWVNQYLNFDLRGNSSIYLIFVCLALGVGVLAGIYPAFRLSHYSPLQAFKSLKSERPSGIGLRKVLGVSQFIISLFFIITSILIARQFNHFLKFDYGFNSKNIVNVALQGNDYQLLSRELSNVPGVSMVSACEFIPATGMTNGIGAKMAGSKEEYTGFEQLGADANFVENLGLTIVAGTNLPADSSGRFILINERGAKQLGFPVPSDIVGKTLDIIPNEQGVVIGVIHDFMFQTPVMQDKAGPLMLRNQPNHFSYLNVKVSSDNIGETLTALEAKWKSMDPVHPFKYWFFDDQLAQVNQWMGDLVSIIGFVASLAIIIACLGLLGMAMYTTERRTKEIGIRKILGAADTSLALLLSKQFLRLLMVSVLIASPISYLINNLWLQQFPNHVEFGLGTIFLGSLILLMLGLITIGSQTIKASKRNPVDVLRME